MGGNSRTLIILCITPSLTHLEQSLSTMRFGVQAKKIENKIQANIITAPNENETVKLLIEDYEKKIKELEKERLEDKEKIRNLNIDLNGKIKISKENLKKTNEVDIEFLEKTGVIFLSSDSQKKQKDIKELLPTKLKKNWQTLIFDSEGKIALEAYCKMKDLQSLFQFNQQQYQENFKDILKEHLELQEKYLILEQKKNDYKTKAKTLYLKLNLTQKELALSHSRLNLIESFIGFKKLSNKEILALEELFSKGLVQCQNERLNRVTKKGSLIKNIEEEESPRKNNRPINLPDEFMEFSEDDQNINSIDSFQELENKIQSKEETRKNKMKIEASRLQEKFAKKIKSITTKITLQKEDLKKFEQNYLDLLLKKTNEDRLAFISNELLLTKKKENIKQKPKFPRIHEPKHLNLSSSSKTEEEFKPSLNLKPPENNRQKFRSLDARETKEISKSDKKITRIKNKSKPAPKGKDFIEMNKKNLGFKLSPSNPLFEPQKKDSNNSIPLDSKIQKAYERGNIFLKEKNIEMEVKLDQMPPKTPVFDSGRIKTDDMENFSTEEEKKKLLNNPKNMLMTLLSNLNNQNQNTTKRSDNSKELTKGNVSESCAFKISNYKSILDKETMKIIEEKKKKLLSSGINKIKGFEKGNEPNESEIEKIVENESFFSNCINGFEYLLTPDLAEKKTSNPFDEIAFESDSGTTKNAITTKKSTAFKKKKK